MLQPVIVALVTAVVRGDVAVAGALGAAGCRAAGGVDGGGAMSLLPGCGMRWENGIQVVMPPVARIARVVWVMYWLMLPLVVVLLRMV